MSYRARINTSDPSFNIALHNAMKGSNAVPYASAEVRGLYSKFAGAEGDRLRRGEQAGKELANQAAYKDALNKRRLQDLAFNRKMSQAAYKVKKDRLDDAKSGMWWNAGLGAVNLGLGGYGDYKDRQAREKQAQFNESQKRAWALRNPEAAYNLEATSPGYFGLRSYIDFDQLNKIRGPRAGQNQWGTSAR